MKISLPQRKHEYNNTKHNLEIIKNELSSTDADLVVFPEMFLTGYRIRDQIPEQAETLSGELVIELSKLAKKSKKALIFGMPERDTVQSGRIFNTAVFIDKKGNIDAYRKFFPVNFGPFEDKRYFHQGLDLPLFELENTKFGIIICYDIFFPELSKSYALRGADLVICISAAPTVSRQFFEIMIPARAVESTVYFAYSNLIGPEKNLTFFGGNTIISPRGDQLAKGKYFEEDNVEGEIDLDELNLARSKRPTLRDSRIELFESITDLLKPNLD
jgi:predicted amidohydrolase